MFKFSAAGLALLFLVSGCGQAPEDRSTANAMAGEGARTSIKIRNQYQEKLLALSDADRDLTLRRAVRDDGGSCSKISGSKYQQDYKGMAMWVAHCSGGDWAVYLSPSGTVQARACKEIPILNRQEKQLDMPACRAAPVDTLAPVSEPRWPDPAPPPQPFDKV